VTKINETEPIAEEKVDTPSQDIPKAPVLVRMSSSAPEHDAVDVWSHVKSRKERKQERGNSNSKQSPTSQQQQNYSNVDFEFDEDMKTTAGAYYDCYDDDDEDSIDDNEINKIYIITQPRNYASLGGANASGAGGSIASSSGSSSQQQLSSTTPSTVKQYDRTADFNTRTKITQDLAKQINDGLNYYEQDLIGASGDVKHTRNYRENKTVNMISQEEFHRLRTRSEMQDNDEGDDDDNDDNYAPDTQNDGAMTKKKLEFDLDLSKLKKTKLRPIRASSKHQIAVPQSATSNESTIVHSLPVNDDFIKSHNNNKPIANTSPRYTMNIVHKKNTKNRFYPVIKDTQVNKVQSGKIENT
jgi:hypothetical protein